MKDAYMAPLKKGLFFMALAAWAASVFVHILSFMEINATDHFPFLALLKPVLFAIGVPALLLLNKGQQNLQPEKQRPASIFQVFAKNAPGWLCATALALFFYFFITFLVFAFSQKGTPAIVDGQYVLQNHMGTVTYISRNEYDHYSADHSRMTSSAWMAFYGMAILILYPFGKRSEKSNAFHTMVHEAL